MPRKGKGGRVEGSSQTAYANRTDLNDRGPQPITSAPGQQYGERQMLEDAQRAVPMGGTPTPQGQLPAAGAKDAAAAPPNMTPEPGQLPWLHPSERPFEHVTTGNSNSMQPLDHQRGLGEILSNAASSPHASTAVVQLAEFAKMLGL
jgi:hypothetical protein